MKKFILLSILALSSASFAKAYGDAGCGLGSVLFGDTPSQASQVFAATTNDSTYTNMFGITSGTSNCIDGGTVKAAQAVPMYIEVNKDALAKDAARGEGETLAGLASLMGCESRSLGSAIKSNYKSIFVDTHMQADGIEIGINQLITNNHQACGTGV
jgi:hypothetical protein